MKLIVSSAAAADLERLRDFLAGKNPAAARQAGAALVAAAESLHSFSQRGRPVGARGIRELIVPFGNSGYVLRYAYSATADEAIILRIWHAREKRQ